MAQPPREPPELATRAHLDALEERLEVHLSVFLDERLVATEARLLTTLRTQLAAQTRTLATVLAAVVAVAGLVLAFVPPR
jgi:hypothetical protein